MNNLRANKASEYLGIGESTLWRWTREGKVSCIKLSEKVTVWQKSELDRFIASKCSNAA
jgi:predicted DNA-binding transcriptional regulator AlpA